jgi:hypothetical protein
LSINGKPVCLAPPQGGGIVTAPPKACINVKYHNNYYLLYSENYAESWVSVCGTDQRIDVQEVGVGHKYTNDRYSGNGCSNTSSCSFSERNYGNAKTIECATGSVKDPRVGSGFVTTPEGYVCGP